jgi:hypothetical protein
MDRHIVNVIGSIMDAIIVYKQLLHPTSRCVDADFPGASRLWPSRLLAFSSSSHGGVQIGFGITLENAESASPSDIPRVRPFFDPLLSRAPLIVEPHYRPAGQAQIRDDIADSRKQLPKVELHLRHYSSCCLPTGRLVEKVLVPDHWFVARPSHGTRQDRYKP